MFIVASDRVTFIDHDVTAAASIFITGSALAQQAQQMPGIDMKGMDMKMMPSPDDPASTKDYKSAMMKMMQAMPKYSGGADVDFMKQMRPHHQAAIDMAKVVLANGKDADAKKTGARNHRRTGERDRDDRCLVEKEGWVNTSCPRYALDIAARLHALPSVHFQNS